MQGMETVVPLLHWLLHTSSVIITIENSHSLLEGCVLFAFVDCKPLDFAVQSLKTIDHKQPHLPYISKFITDMQHVKKHTPAVDDCTSRAVLSNASLKILVLYSVTTRQPHPTTSKIWKWQVLFGSSNTCSFPTLNILPL